MNRLKKMLTRPRGPLRRPLPAHESTLVVVDDRERASGLAGAIERICGLKPRVERLQVGDILIGRRVLIERKAVADFAASIKDGRLFAQVSALRAEPFDPLLIIEGEFTEAAARGMKPAALRGAILSVCLDWHVPVLRSRSTEDTARWVGDLLGRAAGVEGLPDWRGVRPDGSRRPSAELRIRPRKSVVPPQRRRRHEAAQMLSQIEGLGARKAETLLSRFVTLRAVLEASPGELAAADGIGPRLAHRIHAVLHGPEENSPGI